MTSSADDLAAQFGWERRGETVSEGDAFRTSVRLEAGEPALLYTYEDESIAARATAVHSVAVAGELFVVPDAVESGSGWLLVEGIDGICVTDQYDGLSEMSENVATSVVTGVATALRKLHIIESKGYGDVWGPGATYLTFNGWAAALLERFSEHVRNRDFSDATVSELLAQVGDLRHELSAYHPRNPAGLAHSRLQFEHVWIESADNPEVVGLTGFGRAECLPRELDIAHFLWIEGVGRSDELVRAFYKEYGAARTMDVQRRERFFRRLAAFLALSGERGPSPRTEEELIALTRRSS